MKVKKTGKAGSVESNDILILIEPSNNSDIEIKLESVVKDQFGKQICKVIRETIESRNVSSAKVSVIDKGALDFVIKARTEAALFRACGEENESW